MRQTKGSVGVEVNGKRLRLRLPRHVCRGRSRYIYPGLSADNKEHWKVATAKAKQIEADILMERFDPSLKKYLAPDYNEGLVNFDFNLSELWQKYTEFKRHTLSQTTINIDFRTIRNRIAELPTQKLSEAKRIQQALLDKCPKESARRTIMQLKACCDWAQNEGLIQANPFVGLPAIKVPKGRNINPFTRQERKVIIEAFEQSAYYSYYLPFVKFLFWTGCRTSEAVGLQWQHVDPCLEFISFEEALVQGARKATKTSTARRFPTNQALKGLLKDIQPGDRTPNQPVFLSKEGYPVDAHNFLNRAWKSVLADLPIKYRPQYNTRHTFITLSLEEGIPVAQVAAWVGNSSKTIWTHYAGIANLLQVPEPIDEL